MFGGGGGGSQPLPQSGRGGKGKSPLQEDGKGSDMIHLKFRDCKQSKCPGS